MKDLYQKINFLAQSGIIRDNTNKFNDFISKIKFKIRYNIKTGNSLILGTKFLVYTDCHSRENL